MRDEPAQFFRLFMRPGVSHCSGGPGADSADWVTALEQWVENHQAPDEILAQTIDPSGGRAFERLLSRTR
jgi:feruloyl esterase